MADPDGSLDDLIAALRARAADQERRTSHRPTQLGTQLAALDLGGMLSLGRSLAADLGRVVQANREGRVDAPGVARAEELHAAMTTPVDRGLPPPADEAAVAAVESALGAPLPPVLRRVYREVADGGFGPGEGLLPLSETVRVYAELRDPGAMPRGRAWPDGLLPVVKAEPGWDCVETSTGRVIAWDPEGLSERSSEAAFLRSFSEVAPSVEAWLREWLGSRTSEEEIAAMMAEAMSDEGDIRAARAARATIAAMTPEQRAAMGLPEVGWERIVWGGIGWEGDED